MVLPQNIASSWSTGINSTDRTYVDPSESIGDPADAEATDVADENSAFALVKGICAGMGIPAGSGDALVNDDPHVYVDPLETLGDMTDGPTVGSGSEPWSAISLMKGILVTTGLT